MVSRILKKSLSEIIISFTDAVLGLKKAGLYLSEARLGISKNLKAGFGLTKAGLYLPMAESRSERLGLSFWVAALPTFALAPQLIAGQGYH